MPRKAQIDEVKTTKVIVGGIVKTSIEKVSKDAELVSYIYEGEAAKDDLFVVIYDKKLAFLKATKVMNRFEYIKAKNNGIELADLKSVVQRVDIDGYKFRRAVRAKLKELQTALAERIDEAKTSKGLEDVLANIKGQKKTEIEALMTMIEDLKANPEEFMSEDDD